MLSAARGANHTIIGSTASVNRATSTSRQDRVSSTLSSPFAERLLRTIRLARKPSIRAVLEHALTYRPLALARINERPLRKGNHSASALIVIAKIPSSIAATLEILHHSVASTMQCKSRPGVDSTPGYNENPDTPPFSPTGDIMTSKRHPCSILAFLGHKQTNNRRAPGVVASHGSSW
jgi:hypothetical protein